MPGKASEKVAGELRFSAEAGARLSLAGAMGEVPTYLAVKEIPVILGLVWDCPLGSVVTLRDCRLSGLNVASRGIAREEYWAGLLLVNEHLEREEDFSFSQVSVGFSGLPSWADALRGLRQKQIPPEGNSRGGFEVQWFSPEPVAGEIPGGHLVLGVGAEIHGGRRQYSIKENVRMNISCEEPRSCKDLVAKYVYPLQNLMTLATDHPNAVTELTVGRPDSREDIRVLMATLFHDAEVATDLFSHKMLFSLGDIGDQAIEAVAKWISISERLKDACEVYFGIQYMPSSFLDVKFQKTHQSLELYQRRRRQMKGTSDRHDDIPSGDFVAELFEEHRVVMAPLFGGDIPRAIREVAELRDYLVLRDSPLGDKPTYGPDLFWLTQKLMILMKACLLSELGISEEDQIAFFQRNQLYNEVSGVS